MERRTYITPAIETLEIEGVTLLEGSVGTGILESPAEEPSFAPEMFPPELRDVLL